ncbi:MAG: hypothetical protein ACRBBK_10600 [Paracoccaceae bacterium]
MSARLRIRAYWALFSAMLGVYLTMILWSLPRIARDAGAPVFDLRSSRYDYEDARSFLSNLSDEGRDFYLNVQQSLDMIYPALFGIIVAWSLLWAGKGFPRWILRIAVAFALVSMVADYAENAAVRGMLLAGAEGIDPAQVASASARTMLKFSTATVAGIGLILLLARRLYLWRKGRDL